MFYRLRPDVPGTLADETVLDTSVRPPRVEGNLYYEIDNWFGDDLITSHPCFVVTEKMAAALAGSGLGSFEIRGVEITYGEDAQERLERHGLAEFPVFRWLFVTGIAGQDDVGLTPRVRLVVSDAALEVFRQENTRGARSRNTTPTHTGKSQVRSVSNPYLTWAQNRPTAVG